MIVTDQDRSTFREQMRRRRGRGRPRLCDGPAASVKVALPGALYDRIDRLARDRNISVPEAIRCILVHRLPNLGAE